jgi:hypothetical protein
LYISLNFRNETIEEFSTLFKFIDVAKSEMQRLNNIYAAIIYIVNWREMSSLISTIKIIFLWTKCTSIMIEEWLYFELMIFKDHESTLSFNRFSIRKNEHFTCLFFACLRCWSSKSSNLRSQSQINQAFFVILNFDFLIRKRTTAYSWFLACLFTRVMRFLRSTNV